MRKIISIRLLFIALLISNLRSAKRPIYCQLKCNLPKPTFKQVRHFEKTVIKQVKNLLDLEFLRTVKLFNLIPKFSQRRAIVNIPSLSKQIVDAEYKHKLQLQNTLKFQTETLFNKLSNAFTDRSLFYRWQNHFDKYKRNVIKTTQEIHLKKLGTLGYNFLHSSFSTSVYNLSSYCLTPSQLRLLQRGPNLYPIIIKLMRISAKWKWNNWLKKF